MFVCKYDDYGLGPRVMEVRRTNKEIIHLQRTIERSNGFDRSNYSTQSKSSQRKGLKLSKRLDPNKENNNRGSKVSLSQKFPIGRNYGLQQAAYNQNTNYFNCQFQNRSSRQYEIQKSASQSSFKIVPTHPLRNSTESFTRCVPERTRETPRTLRRCLTEENFRETQELKQSKAKTNQRSQYFRGSIIDDLKGLTLPSMKKTFEIR